MAKTVTVTIDTDAGALYVSDGKAFLGEVAPLVFDGVTLDTGHSIRLTLFARDKVTPLADNSADPTELDLRLAALRSAFLCQAPQKFYAVANELDENGDFVTQVLAAGYVTIAWSPEVFDVEDATVATLQGPAGSAGADGKSTYQLAVEQGYTGTIQQWLASYDLASALSGHNFDHSAATVRKIADALKTIFETLGGTTT